ncbi:MAG TPA: serine hydrolase domain-containing protein, partial [Terriglobia bacterium]|nr:serine hydrolase domain-containing protein [Terriglobia bacterium]
MQHKFQVEAVRSKLEFLVRDSKVPGIQFLVLDRDRTIFEYNGGWADIADRRKVDASTTMMAYSMSKTITAVAVLQLAAAGKLQLDDAIDRYVDSQPYGPGITVRHLLTHTSGIPNPIPLSWIHSPAAHDKFQEKLALESVMSKHPKLAFLPGTKFGYSNIGYWLLGPIVERVSGESFTNYVRLKIFAPLGIAPG